MLELNLTAYSYGLGLVLAAWFGGLIVGYALSIANISKIL
jgi:hypothetical protein